MLFLEDPYRDLVIGAPCLRSVIEANDLRLKAIAAAQEAGSIPVGVHPRRAAGPHPVPLNVVATMNPEFASFAKQISHPQRRRVVVGAGLLASESQETNTDRLKAGLGDTESLESVALLACDSRRGRMQIRRIRKFSYATKDGFGS